MKRFVLFLTFCVLCLLPSVYAVSSSAEKVITEFLQKFQHTDLRFQERKSSDLGSHFIYQHYLGGLPVEGSVLAIHLNDTNQIIAVQDSVHSKLTASRSPIHPVAKAHSSAFRFFGNHAKTSAGQLVILPMAGNAVQAWKIQVDSENLTQGSFLLYIDALRPNVILRVLKTHTPLTGEGNVYLENPVVSANRSKQPFLYLHGEKLNGKFLKTFNANDEHDVNEFRFSDFTTASNPNSKYNFRENDLRLSEAMAYFHINRVHDRWKQFGMTVLNSQAPVFVNVTEEDGGKGLDNAFYSRVQQFANTGVYVFGSGEELENLGLDADVYYHEYGHGVLDQSRPQFLESFESNYPRAFMKLSAIFQRLQLLAIQKLANLGFGLRRHNDLWAAIWKMTIDFPKMSFILKSKEQKSIMQD